MHGHLGREDQSACPENDVRTRCERGGGDAQLAALCSGSPDAVDQSSGLVLLKYPARLIKIEAGISRIQTFVRPIADIAQEVRLPSAIRKEIPFQRFAIEAGHRTGIQTERAGSKNQVGALKRRASPDQIFDQGALTLELGLQIP